MLYRAIGAATFLVSSICVLTQLVLLPWLDQYTQQLKNDFGVRLRQFHKNARIFDDQFRRVNKLGNSLLLDNSLGRRARRQLQDCPPQRMGAPGNPGEAGTDGEPGDAGTDGQPGLDAITLLMEEAKKCVICPQGPEGPVGAPGQQGLPGSKGDKGEPGMPGTDGIDGEQGPEGLPGHPGIAGKQGKKGTSGMPAPGGTGPPGGPGVKGPPGQTGKQGERGKRNFVIGMPGPDGRVGKQGLDGLEGKPGLRGEKGPPGEDGADAKFCPCPSELGQMGPNGATGGQQQKLTSHLSPPLGGGESAPRGQPSAGAFSATTPSPPPPPSAPFGKIEEDKSKPIMSSSEAKNNKLVPATMGPMTRSSTPEVVASSSSPKPTLATTAEGRREQGPNSRANVGLRMGQLKPGERPKLAQAEKGQNYDDAYPNYESGSEQQKEGEGAVEKNGGGGGAQQYDEEGEEGTEARREDEENNNEAEEAEDSADGGRAEQATATRRFVYVTKRPRLKL